MSNTIAVPRDVAIEALSCVLVRARWNVKRRRPIPSETLAAMISLCETLDISLAELGVGQ